MLKLVCIFCSLAALSAASPIYPEFVPAAYYQNSEEDLLFPFDTVDDWHPQVTDKYQRVAVGSRPGLVSRPYSQPVVVPSETPVYIAPGEPGFEKAYASLNPLEYVADLQEEEEKKNKRKWQNEAEGDYQAEDEDDDERGEEGASGR